jgi:hypothetical protein
MTSRGRVSAGQEPVHNAPLSTKLIVRNVLILGKSRAGKSTLQGMLEDPALFALPMSLFRGTKDATLRQTLLEWQGQRYLFNVLDTPGLFEKEAKSKSGKRDNTTLLDMLQEDIEEVMDVVHCVFIVLPLHWDSDDIESVSTFLNFFKGGETVVSLGSEPHTLSCFLAFFD